MSRSLLLAALVACLVLILLPSAVVQARFPSALHSALKRPVSSPSADPHFINNVTVASGQWTGTISVLYQYLTFTDARGATIQSFPVSPAAPYQFGTVLYDSDTFDVIYQVSLVESVAWPVVAVDKRVCLFVVSAYSAGKPQVSAIPFNGNVTCSWTSGPALLNLSVE